MNQERRSFLKASLGFIAGLVSLPFLPKPVVGTIAARKVGVGVVGIAPNAELKITKGHLIKEFRLNEISLVSLPKNFEVMEPLEGVYYDPTKGWEIISIDTEETA